MTDIDRLHKVFTGQLTGNRCGKSFLQCHLLAGIIESTNIEEVICVLRSYSDLEYLVPMMKQVFEEHELQLNRADRYTFYCNEKIINFMMFDKTKEGQFNYYQNNDHYYKIYME